MPLPTSVRELDDDSIAFLLEAYIDRAGTGDPLVPPPPALTALCAALYGPGRSGPGGDADDDRRVWKHVCAKLGLAALPAYAGAPTTWKAAFAALRAEVSQLSDDGRTNFRRVVRRNPYSYELLREASRDGHALVVAVILARASAAVVNASDDIGQGSALVLASGRGHLAVVVQLLAARADVNVRDIGDRSALVLASRQGHLAVVVQLLAAGADVKERDIYNESALIGASAFGHLAVVEALLAHNADVEACNDWGTTALINASERGHLAIVNQLLAAGANVEARANDSRAHALTLPRPAREP